MKTPRYIPFSCSREMLRRALRLFIGSACSLGRAFVPRNIIWQCYPLFPYISTANAFLFSRRERIVSLLRFDLSNLNALVAQQLLRFGAAPRRYTRGNSVPGFPDESPQSDLFLAVPDRRSMFSCRRCDNFVLASRRERSTEIPRHHIVNVPPRTLFALQRFTQTAMPSGKSHPTRLSRDKSSLSILQPPHLLTANAIHLSLSSVVISVANVSPANCSHVSK